MGFYLERGPGFEQELEEIFDQAAAEQMTSIHFDEADGWPNSTAIMFRMLQRVELLENRYDRRPKRRYVRTKPLKRRRRRRWRFVST